MAAKELFSVGLAACNEPAINVGDCIRPFELSPLCTVVPTTIRVRCNCRWGLLPTDMKPCIIFMSALDAMLCLAPTHSSNDNLIQPLCSVANRMPVQLET